jgi:hypothetical protein
MSDDLGQIGRVAVVRMQAPGAAAPGPSWVSAGIAPGTGMMLPSARPRAAGGRIVALTEARDLAQAAQSACLVLPPFMPGEQDDRVVRSEREAGGAGGFA